MDELQQNLVDWFKSVYKRINEMAEKEAEAYGYKKELFETNKLKLVHHITPGSGPGFFLATFGVVEGKKPIKQILSAEFTPAGYVVRAHRKTILHNNVRNIVLAR